MTTWAIGDVHACLDDLRELLARIEFEPDRDRLLFVGDLVNRGPRSADTLRFVRDLGDRAISVLGNHDLHLLATAADVRAPRRKDSFADVLAAPDRAELLAWLRRRPLLHHDAESRFTIVHAGLHPAWDLATARQLAGEIEGILRGPDFAGLLASMYGDHPAAWSPGLSGHERHRLAINSFTRMRYCRPDGSLDFRDSGPPGSQSAGLLPWFEIPGRANADLHIVFGHWSALGCFRGCGVHGLDSGCFWGNALTALCLDDPETVVQIRCSAVSRSASR